MPKNNVRNIDDHKNKVDDMYTEILEALAKIGERYADMPIATLIGILDLIKDEIKLAATV